MNYDTFVCSDCYDELNKVNLKLIHENEILKDALERAGVELPSMAPPVFVCPALAEMLGLKKLHQYRGVIINDRI
jgi:hypothetical protein